MNNLVPSTHSRKHWAALAVLAGLVIARLCFSALVALRPELAIANDTDRYVPIANAILSGQALLPNPSHTGLLLNTIGYPLFLAGVYLVLGHSAAGVALVQLLVTGLVALLFYIVLSRYVGTAAALTAALVLVLDPLTILWSMTILTETLVAVVLGLAALTMTYWAIKPRTTTLLLAGVLTGLACLVKPYAILAVGIWALALVLYPSSEITTWRQRLPRGVRRAVLFVAPTLLLALPWVLRNAIIWDCPGLSSVDRVSMRDYVAAKILSEANGESLDQVQAELQSADPGVCPAQNAKYVGIIFTHFAMFAKLDAAGTIPVLIGTNFDRWFQYFGDPYTLPDLWGPLVDGGPGRLASVLWAEWLRFPQGLMVMLSMVFFQMLVYGLALTGVLLIERPPSPAIRWNILILTIAILVLVLAPGQGGNERFRVPVQPMLAILVGYGVAWKIRPALGKAKAPKSADLSIRS